MRASVKLDPLQTQENDDVGAVSLHGPSKLQKSSQPNALDEEDERISH